MKALFAARLDSLRKMMRETGTDLVALGPSRHMVWLTGLDPHGDERPVLLLISDTHAGILIPALNADAARVVTDLPLVTWRDDDGPDAAFKTLLAECGVAGKSGLNVVLDETMRAEFALRLLGHLEAPKHDFTSKTVGRLRARKDKEEYDALLASARINDAAVAAAFKSLRSGMTERDVLKIIHEEYQQHGVRAEFTSVCFGGNGAFPHHHTGHTVLEDGMAILIDTGCRAHGYPSDMTRCGWFGTPDPQFGEVCSIVEEAVCAALAAAKPGVSAADVDAAARTVIEAAGYGAQFPHRTGHGVGLDIHEEPYISAANKRALEAGNVFSIEPGIYLEGRFGIRLEEVVFLTDAGPEILSSLSRTPVHRT